MNGAPMPLQFAMLFGTDGPLEWIVIALAVLLLFGSRRLPETMRTLGRLSAKLYRARDEFRNQFQKAIEEQRSEVGEQRSEVEPPDSDLPPSTSDLPSPAPDLSASGARPVDHGSTLPIPTPPAERAG